MVLLTSNNLKIINFERKKKITNVFFWYFVIVLALEALEKEVSDVANTVMSGNSEKSDKLLRRGFKNWEER